MTTDGWRLSRWFPADSRQRALVLTCYAISLAGAVWVIVVFGVVSRLPLETLALVLFGGVFFVALVTMYYHATFMGWAGVRKAAVLMLGLSALLLWVLALWPSLAR